MLILLFLVASIIALHAESVERPIVVFVPSYNNMPFYKKNLDSIFAQEYGNYHIIYVDDCSTDGTGHAVAAYVQERNLSHKISIVRNPVRRGALYNHYMVAHAVPDGVIIATLDGDDWFPDTNTKVLARVNEAYQNSNVWMTFGQFAEYPSGRRGFCRPLYTCNLQDMYRDYPWIISHLRTFYAGLFKQIPVGYFIRDDNFLQATGDLAIMFSLLELSGGRAHYIDEILYMYNTTNANSDCYTRQREQIHNDHWIRARAPLKPLQEHPAYMAIKSAPAVYNWHISHESNACHHYCATIIQGGIAAEAVTIFYHTHNNDAYEQLHTHSGVTTIGIDSSCDAKTSLLAQLDMLPAESFILLTTDGCTWQSSVNWHDCMKTMIKTKALSFVPTSGIEYRHEPLLTNTTKNPNLIWLYEQYHLWKPAAAQGIAHHPYAAPAFLISKPRLQYALSQIHGATLRELLDNLAYLASENSDDVIVCSTHPSCIYKG